ncbi:MAG: single-stranded-DNA-specific exonuclease RecJ [Epsilonproteobacteria bacterium]|nr:single-stranded-DNA-specific exonuclease RecJ [Campylobacterota bacterium]
MTKLPKLTKEKIASILFERFNGKFLNLKDLPSPFLFKDMQKGIKRVVSAIKNKEKIALIGDYDVDGVVSISIVREFFREIKYPIEWIIPNRFEDGYGISKSVIDKLNSPNLIVTFDNGISAIEAANYCKDIGIDLIITDHHNIPLEVPSAYAIINQKQDSCNFPFKEICGAQIAWYFIAALSKELNIKIDLKKYLDLLSLAIIADIMPLKDINRTMVKRGLEIFSNSKRASIVALKEMIKKESIKVDDIAYFIAPLINSAGRMDDASIASNFLLSNDINEARELLLMLNLYNNSRRDFEEKIFEKAILNIDESSRVIVVSDSNFHEGVVGIVASRIAQKFKKPTIVLSCDREICKGSGRSYGECDLFKLVESQKRFLEKFGGHKSAIGLSIKKENLDLFLEGLNKKAKDLCDMEYIDPSILGYLDFREIDFELMKILEKFEPYGEGNLKPKFITTNVEVRDSFLIGNNRHTKYLLSKDRKNLNGLFFRRKEPLKIGERVDIVYELSLNFFQNQYSIDLILSDIKRR